MEYQNALEILNIEKRYKDFKLDNISFSLPKGCVMGLIGENGAGKSTLIKIITGLSRQSSGEVRLFGNNNISQEKANLGIVLDNNGLPLKFNAKILNSVYRRAYEQWNEEQFFDYLKRFDLPDNKPFCDLSRGMKMKLNIAAALSHNAQLLILDEATSGLDPIIRDEILDVFYDYISDGERSILISSHIVSDLEKICDYISFIHRGKLMLCDEKDAVKTRYGILRLSPNDIADIDRSAIVGIKSTQLSNTILVDKSRLPRGYKTEKASIEDIMLLMSHGNKYRM